jgi:hypothetical protein
MVFVIYIYIRTLSSQCLLKDFNGVFQLGVVAATSFTPIESNALVRFDRGAFEN